MNSAVRTQKPAAIRKRGTNARRVVRGGKSLKRGDLQRIRALWSKTEDGRELGTQHQHPSELSYYLNTATFALMLRLEEMELRLRKQRPARSNKKLLDEILATHRECELLAEIASFLLRGTKSSPSTNTES